MGVMTVSTVKRGEGRGQNIMHMEPLEPLQKTAPQDRSPHRWTVPHPVFSTITTICDNRIVIHMLLGRNVVTYRNKGTYNETEGSRFT